VNGSNATMDQIKGAPRRAGTAKLEALVK